MTKVIGIELSIYGLAPNRKSEHDRFSEQASRKAMEVIESTNSVRKTIGVCESQPITAGGQMEPESAARREQEKTDSRAACAILTAIREAGEIPGELLYAILADDWMDRPLSTG